MALELTDANFATEVTAKTDKLAVVDFWAEWCGPCRQVGPIVDELAKEYGDQAVIGKVNVDTNSALAVQFGIRNLPTILFIKNGEVVDKQVGIAAKTAIDAKIKAHL